MYYYYTMNNKSFILALSQRSGFSQEDAQKMIYTMVDAMNGKFQEAETVNIADFGVFEVKKRMERIMTNPSTQQKMLVPPKIVLSFRPANALKERLK